VTIGQYKIRRRTDDRPPVSVRVVEPCVIDGYPRALGAVLTVPAAVAGELRHLGRVVLASTPISGDERTRLDYRRELTVRVVRPFADQGTGAVRMPGDLLTIDRAIDGRLLTAGFVEPVTEPAPAPAPAKRRAA
jgi:hypothetical protein